MGTKIETGGGCWGTKAYRLLVNIFEMQVEM